MKPKLTPKQKKFCVEYMIDGATTAAAIRAGYSPKSAKNLGNRTLRKPHVKAEIDRLQAEAAERNAVDIDKVVQGIAAVAFAKPEIEATRDRLKALELLGKKLGMFTQKVEHSIEQVTFLQLADIDK